MPAGRVEFGGIVAESGTKVRGTFRLGDGVDEVAPTPGAVVNGRRPGPKAWLLSGIHGDEIESMVAVQRVVRDLDPDLLSGAIIALVVVNPTAFRAWQRESPIDGKDLNRVFPGNQVGTYTERLAHALFQSIVPVISSDDVLFNLHGGGRTVLSARLIEVRGTGDEIEERCMELARIACNPNLRIVARIEERSGVWAELYKGTILREIFREVPVARLTFESGGMGRLEERDILAHYDGILNVLKHLRMYPGSTKDPDGEILTTHENVRVMPTIRGFWRRHVDVADRVSKGQLLATVLSDGGDEIEHLHSPYDEGIILYVRGFGLVDPLSSKLSDQYGVNLGKE